MDELAPPLVFGEPEQPRNLRQAIGASPGKLTYEQHLNRTKFVLDHIPEALWPATSSLKDKYAGKAAAIAGGGPSLESTMPALRAQHERGDVIVAPNKSHDWLISGEREGRKKWKRRPLIPTFGVLTDPDFHVSTYVKPHPEVSYMLGTILDYRVLTGFLKAGSACYLWYPAISEDGKDVEDLRGLYGGRREINVISGASTVGLRTVGILVGLGCPVIDLHGFDSCYAPGTTTLYSYAKPVITTQRTRPVAVSNETGHQFRCHSNHHMAKQAMEFEKFIKRLHELTVDGKIRPTRIRVHGDGLIPWMAWKDGGPDKYFEHATPDRMKAKYGDAQYWDYDEGRPHDKPFEKVFASLKGLEFLSENP